MDEADWVVEQVYHVPKPQPKAGETAWGRYIQFNVDNFGRIPETEGAMFNAFVAAEVAAKLKRAVEVVRKLSDGMKASERAGCTDHLDCWDDAGTMWYRPLEEAAAVLTENP